IDPADAARRVTGRTRAILPVHLHGLPADMDAISVLARSAGLTVVEDAAQAHGALYKGRAVGTLGAMAAFSLNSTKNLPAGEGGLFVTSSEEHYARAARVRFDGLEPPSKWDATHPLDDEAEALATHPLFASPERYPNAAAALDASLVVGSQSYPLFAQPLEVVDAWADGFEKVWNAILGGRSGVRVERGR